MNHSYNTNPQATNSSSPGDPGGDNESERITTSSKSIFIGKDKLLEQFRQQLKQFEEWHKQRDWLAFHHHHYDWWMFPSEFKIELAYVIE